MPPRDDEASRRDRRDQAVDLAGLRAEVRGEVRRLDERIGTEHEYIESVSRRHGELATTVQEIERIQSAASEQTKGILREQKKGSERMDRIEGDVRELRDGQATLKADARVAARTVAIYLAVALGGLQLLLWGVGLLISTGRGTP